MNVFESSPLWTAIITPFNDDLSVDFDSFKRLLKTQEEAGNAVVLLGSTGESLALSVDERKEVIEFALKQNFKI